MLGANSPDLFASHSTPFLPSRCSYHLVAFPFAIPEPQEVGLSKTPLPLSHACSVSSNSYFDLFLGSPCLSLGTYLWKNGDAEGLVGDLTHEVERDDWENVPGGGACLPAHQLLTQPKAIWKLLCLCWQEKGNNEGSASIPSCACLHSIARALCRLLWGRHPEQEKVNYNQGGGREQETEGKGWYQRPRMTSRQTHAAGKFLRALKYKGLHGVTLALAEGYFCH